MSEEKLNAEEQEKQEPKKARGGFLLKVLTIALVVVGSSVIGAASSWFFAARLAIPAGVKAVEAKAEAEAEDPETAKFNEAVENGAVVPLEPFVVNLADPDASRFLRITVKLMVDDKHAVEELIASQTILSKVRDVILELLTQKTSADLLTQEGKKALRQEIHHKIEVYFKEPKLIDVMFTELVLQL